MREPYTNYYLKLETESLHPVSVIRLIGYALGRNKTNGESLNIFFMMSLSFLLIVSV